MNRKLRIILVSIGTLILVLLILPFLIPVDRFRSSIEERASAILERRVTLGNLRLSLFGGSFAAEDLSIDDDLKFSRSPFLTAKSVTVSVQLLPLIFSKTINIMGITIHDPQVTLIRNALDQWNYSSLGSSSVAAQPIPPAGPGKSWSSIKELELTNGEIDIRSTNSDRLSTYDHVNVSASNVSATSRFPVLVTSNLPSGGKFSFKGTVGPVDRANASLTPIDAKVAIRSLDLASTGFLTSSFGLGGVLDLDETLSLQNGEVETKGIASLSNAVLIVGGSPAPEPMVVDFSTRFDLSTNNGVLNPSTLTIGNASAHLDGTYQSTEETILNIKAVGQDMPAKDLESFLPALGIILPKGAALQDGTVNANLDLTGATNKIIVAGNVGLFRAKLTGFDLGSKTAAISSLTGIPTGKDLQIEKLTTNLRMVPDGLKVDQLVVVVPSFGELVGSGSIDSRNNLDFKMTATLIDASAADRTLVPINLSGTYQLRSRNPMLNLTMTGQKLPIDELQARMNAAGIKLPNGAILKGGTLDIELVFTGPPNALTITGPIELNKTREIGFDPGSRMRGVAALSRIKTGDTTSIENLQANLRITRDGTEVDEVYARIPTIGVITGSGTVSPKSDLDFALSVKVTAAQGIGKIGAGVLTRLDDSAGSSGGHSGVPMLVTGTANEPIITADVHGIFDRKKKAFLDRFRTRNN